MARKRRSDGPHPRRDHPRLAGVWDSMIQRCYNPARHNYPRYGGRGIGVCPEWRAGSAAFIEWALANGYAEGLVLDRIDNDGPYSPENCRWSTVGENNRNTRRNVTIELCGIEHTVSEWRETLGISEFTLYWWIREYGKEGCERRVYERLLRELGGKAG